LFIFSNGYIICYKPIRFSCCIALHKFPCMGLFKLMAHSKTINPKLTLVRVGIIIFFRIVYFKTMFQPSLKIKCWSHIKALVNMFVFPLIFVILNYILSHSNLYGHPHFPFFLLFSVVGIEKNVSWSLYWRTSKFVDCVQLWYVATFSLNLVIFCAPNFKLWE
jgi:hypothetical protein